MMLDDDIIGLAAEAARAAAAEAKDGETPDPEVLVNPDMSVLRLGHWMFLDHNGRTGSEPRPRLPPAQSTTWSRRCSPVHRF
jgi:hypothetical protein